jgi:DNA adenine methylase
MLNEQAVRFALSNITYYKGSKNNVLLSWMGKYNIYNIESNCINYYNSSRKIAKEVLVINYKLNINVIIYSDYEKS